jgi:ABC-type phosphate/phosphonate transport system substrate-binding protein
MDAGPLLACLPMYDFPELVRDHDRLWAALATRLRRTIRDVVPDVLTRPTALMPIWRHPRLLLGQTCGWPLVTELAGTVRLVATPVYDAPGCDGARHRSAIVVRTDDPAATLADLRGRRCAINGWDSNTGMNLLRATIAPLAGGGRFFHDVEISGSHQQSLRLVGAGIADVAAIDAVSLALLGQIEPDLVGATRILGWTPASPGLPLITAPASSDATVEALREALADVFADPDLADIRHRLRLAGVEVLGLGDYEPVRRLEAEAMALGYPRLA